MPELPRYAYLKNHGRVRILSYMSPATFCVLTVRDERRFVSRDQLVFIKSRTRQTEITK